MITIKNVNNFSSLPSFESLDQFQAFCDSLSQGRYYYEASGGANCERLGLPKSNGIITIYKINQNITYVQCFFYNYTIQQHAIKKYGGTWEAVWTAL